MNSYPYSYSYSYPAKAGQRFAAELVKASIAGDTQGAMDAERRWYASADQIAVFLSRLNPYLPENMVRQMFYEHLALTKQVTDSCSGYGEH